MSPSQRQTTEITAAFRVTVRNVRQIRMADRAGNTIRLEISSAPIIRIPRTITMAVSRAIRVLYTSDFVPVARAKFSSKVTAKIRW